MRRLVVLWITLGWSLPLLFALRWIAEIQEHYWTTDGTKIHWHHDEEMSRVAEWCQHAIQKFQPKPKR